MELSTNSNISGIKFANRLSSATVNNNTYNVPTYNEDGSLKQECKNIYVTMDENNYYSINIPSNVGGNIITTLGSSLFSAASLDDSGYNYASYNNYSKIKDITIENGINSIEDSNFNLSPKDIKTTFMAVGSLLGDNTYFNINLPSSLNYIGTGAFFRSNLKTVKIPSNVQSIGMGAFSRNSNLTTLVFEFNKNGNSSLNKIGNNAFNSCNLTYDTSSLIIPSSVQTIEHSAFNENPNLKKIEYNGDSENILNSTSWYDSYVTELNPSN